MNIATVRRHLIVLTAILSFVCEGLTGDKNMLAATQTGIDYRATEVARDVAIGTSDDLVLFATLAEGRSTAVTRTDAAVIAALSEIIAVSRDPAREIGKVDNSSVGAKMEMRSGLVDFKRRFRVGVQKLASSHGLDLALATAVAFIIGYLAPALALVTNNGAAAAMMKNIMKMAAAALLSIGQ